MLILPPLIFYIPISIAHKSPLIKQKMGAEIAVLGFKNMFYYTIFLISTTGGVKLNTINTHNLAYLRQRC
jgi:hypothetical protein